MTEELPELVVRGRERHLIIRDLVAEGQAQLRGVDLQYVFTGKPGHEVLRGRPVAFALWSDTQKRWTIAHLEIPRPPVKWKPGHGPLPFMVRTPGIEVQHVKGTGAERLMFAFSRNGEALKVYGAKIAAISKNIKASSAYSIESRSVPCSLAVQDLGTRCSDRVNFAALLYRKLSAQKLFALRSRPAKKPGTIRHYETTFGCVHDGMIYVSGQLEFVFAARVNVTSGALVCWRYGIPDCRHRAFSRSTGFGVGFRTPRNLEDSL